MSPAQIGKEVGAAIKVGGPWVVMALAVIGVVVMAVYPDARADAFTGSEAQAMNDRLESAMLEVKAELALHDKKDAHEGAGRNLAAINVQLKGIQRELAEIKQILRGR